MWVAAAAVREAFFGNVNEARRDAKTALSFSREPMVEYSAALALALTRDLAASYSLTEDLDRHFPENTSVRSNYLPTLRALSALSHGNSPAALAQLRTSARYEMGIGATGTGLYGILYPVYVRGEAELATHKSA